MWTFSNVCCPFVPHATFSLKHPFVHLLLHISALPIHNFAILGPAVDRKIGVECIHWLPLFPAHSFRWQAANWRFVRVNAIPQVELCRRHAKQVQDGLQGTQYNHGQSRGTVRVVWLQQDREPAAHVRGELLSTRMVYSIAILLHAFSFDSDPVACICIRSRSCCMHLHSIATWHHMRFRVQTYHSAVWFVPCDPTRIWMC